MRGVFTALRGGAVQISLWLIADYMFAERGPGGRDSGADEYNGE